MKPIQILTHNSYTIEIYNDETPPNPRTEFSNLGRLVCWHKRYNLGDEHLLSAQEIAEIAVSGSYIALPVYLYDHSGLVLATKPFTCVFDSGQVGIIYAKRSDVQKEYGVQRISSTLRAKVLSILENEVKTYNDFISGEVYGYVIKEDDTDIDSCWGFYELEFCISEAKEFINSLNSKNTNSNEVSL